VSTNSALPSSRVVKQAVRSGSEQTALAPGERAPSSLRSIAATRASATPFRDASITFTFSGKPRGKTTVALLASLRTVPIA
jgi:hypothetical protein